jgi:2'-5' RNA ligase
MRLFVAIGLNDELLTALEAVQQQIKQQGIRARYACVANMHLSLAFLGQTALIREAETALQQVVNEWFMEPLDIALSEFGVFHGHRRGTIWVGVAHDPNLILLARQLQKRLRDVGFDIDERKYRPHITLARNAHLTGDIWVEVPQRRMLAETISLFRSDIEDERRIYTEVSSYSLTGS